MNLPPKYSLLEYSPPRYPESNLERFLRKRCRILTLNISKKLLITLKESLSHDRSSNVSILADSIVLSIILGFLDVILSILAAPVRFESPVYILLPLAATTAAAFMVFWGLWLIIGIALQRIFDLNRAALSAALGCLIASALILSGSANISFSPHGFPKTMLLFAVVVLASAGGYFAWIAASRSGRNRVFGLLITALPLLLGEAAAAAWLHVYRLGAMFAAKSVMLNFGLLSAAVLTLILFYKLPRAGRQLNYALCIALVLSPAALWLPYGTPQKNAAPARDQERRIKRVILIIIDTLRQDALTFYNPGGAPTPHIDSFARDAVAFDNVFSAASWTLPAVSSIMTGLSPAVHRAIRIKSVLHDSVPTLAEYMRDAGYSTAAIGENTVLTSPHNVSQGFMEFDFFPKLVDDGSFGTSILMKVFKNKLKFNTTTSDLSDMTVSWLQKHKDEDFFLWLHYFDPHQPYIPPGEFVPEGKAPPGMNGGFGIKTLAVPLDVVSTQEQRDWIKKLYFGEVRYVDRDINKVFAVLKQLDIYDETLVVLTSDHGEEFWEHDNFAHGRSLYNEVLRVPLLIKLPGSANAGRRKMQVSTSSIMPTILDLCDIEYDDEHLSSGSLSSYLAGTPPDNGKPGQSGDGRRAPSRDDSPAPPRHSFSEPPVFSTGLLYNEDRQSVIFNGKKFIRSLVTGREELYDLDADPGENTSLLPVMPDAADQARSLLKAFDEYAKAARIFYNIKDIKAGLDKETLERLKSLGYI